MNATEPILLEARPIYSLHDAIEIMLQMAVNRLKPHTPDKQIHEVRKDLKRIRAALRLLREAVGENEYRRSNRAIRDAAKPLTPIRDAAALAETVDDLANEASRRDARYVRQLRGLLKKERQAGRKRLTVGAIQGSVHRLNDVLQRIGASPIRQPDAVTVILGLTRVYQRGERAMRRAKRKAQDDRLHEWRKQTKYFLNALTLVKSLWHLNAKRKRKRSRRLADVLGDDHDLAVLNEKIRLFRRRGLLNSKVHRHFKGRIKARRRLLLGKALHLGSRLYAKPVRKFEAKIQRAVAPR